MQRGYLRVGVAALISGCSFNATVTGDAAVEIDAMIDAPDASTGLPASCKTLKMSNPAATTGMYMIDPDRDGPDPAFLVACDMATEGGGWTVIFLPTSSNFSSAAIGYTASSARLLNDATQVLLAYRNASLAAVSERAMFPMIQAWRVATPFSYAGMDTQVTASINGGSPVTSTLKFGNSTFVGDRCEDPWDTGTRWGRICIVGTGAPFYTAFSSVIADTCTQSQAHWNTRNCGTDLRFTIAVR